MLKQKFQLTNNRIFTQITRKELTVEAMIVDRLEEQKEIRPMFGKLLKVFVDHVQSAFEHSVEYLGNLWRNTFFQLVNNRRHR